MDILIWGVMGFNLAVLVASSFGNRYGYGLSWIIRNIWENDSRTPNKEWMMKVKQQISEKVSWVEELNVTEVIRKRKNWSAPGVDGIPNFWWKNLKTT